MSRIGKRIIETVGIMAEEWEAEIDRSGVLSTDYMRRSLQRRRYRGQQVLVPKTEAPYTLMDWLMCGEVTEEDLRLCDNVKDLLLEDAV